jgi:hypothetical protein
MAKRVRGRRERPTIGVLVGWSVYSNIIHDFVNAILGNPRHGQGERL